MAESKQAPDSVEPRTRRGRRKMDNVHVDALRSRTTFDEKQRQKRAKTRSRTADLTELQKQAKIKAEQRAERWSRTKTRALSATRVAMVVGPITAPMSVAWTGQSGFATGVLGWTFLASLLYAAAYELTTVFAAWMYHEARKDGDKGWEYRALTWFFATGAGVQQWWHYSDNWHATARSVTYSSMTAIGIMVWEAYARLIHRRKLRADGKIGQARPRIGLARWIRYPRISWTAWSMSVRYGLTDINDLWQMAEMKAEQRKNDRQVRARLKKENRELKKRVADLEKTPAAKTEPTPDLSTPNSDLDLSTTLERADLDGSGRISPDPGRVNIGPQADRKAIEAGPQEPDPGSEDTTNFEPTDLEKRAVADLIRDRERINRTNVANKVRELVADLGADVAGQTGINTKRAAIVAAWGRANTGGADLKAVGE